MLSKAVFDAMWNDFDTEFGALSEHDAYLQQMTRAALTLVDDWSQTGDGENAIINLISAASRLGFIIGLRTGADMMKSLPDMQFPQQMLESTGDWRP